MRKQKRLQKRHIRRCQVQFNNGGEPVRGIASDFSLTGLFVRSTHPMPEGSNIEISIELPDGQYAKVRGEVVRSSKQSSTWYAGKKITLTSEKEGMGILITEPDEIFAEFVSSLPE